MKITRQDPPPFCVIIDTREQHPLPFPAECPTRRDTLYPADYSEDSLLNIVRIEKKDLGDLIGTLVGKSPKADGSTIARKQKFVEELTAMARGVQHPSVVVTDPLRAIEQNMYQSSVPPANILRMIHDIHAETGVPFLFFDNKQQAANWVMMSLYQHWEIVHGLSSIKYTMRKLRPERLKVRIPPPPPKRI